MNEGVSKGTSVIARGRLREGVRDWGSECVSASECVNEGVRDRVSDFWRHIITD